MCATKIKPTETTSRERVLVVDDDPKIAMFVSANFKARGYQVLTARNGEEALEQAALEQPQVILLDLAMPKLDGFEVLSRLREWSDSQVIVLSAHGGDQEKVKALDLGADDYITKPFSMEELLARVRLALRRLQRFQAASATGQSSDQSPLVTVGEVAIDLAARTVRRGADEVSLTKTEYELLRLLVINRGRVLTHRELLQQVWGPEYGDETEYLRTFIRNLRRKLETDPSRPIYIATEAGVGYRFKC
ncbi:MAG TPA: response regulator transcription factor [Chloroflexia bacterium]|nr:response regulator transcription factor [Chloroflexia bacterium]